MGVKASIITQQWTSELALGTKDGDSWYQALGFQGSKYLYAWPVVDQRCIHPVGTRERRLMNTSKTLRCIQL